MPASADSARLAHQHRRVPSRSEASSLMIDAIYESAKLLTGSADTIKALTSVLNVLSSFVGLKHGAVALLTEFDAVQNAAPGARNPYVIAATTQGPKPMPPDCGAIPPAAAQCVFKTGVALVSPDIAGEFGADSLPPHSDGSRLAMIAVPIRDPSYSPLVLGVLCAYREASDGGIGQLDGDLRLLTMIATLVVQALRFRRLVARDRDRMMREARRAISTAEGFAKAPRDFSGIDGIVGSSPAIATVTNTLRKVARTNAPVLLRGESGTGKELFAQALHRLSDRRQKPFIRVNCAALSETLLETELFGHEKGAFTGAVAQKKGRFELADGGTLFLDEIGEISLEFQAKLLRVLQEGEFERVGGSRTLKVDVRVVTATNKDLEAAVVAGTFRADLYFRICVVPILLPPLRERREDIPNLASAFLDRFNAENQTDLELAASAMDTLESCAFPGNVRELENCINRVAALARGPVIEAEDMACSQNMCLSSELWRMLGNSASPVGGIAAGSQVQIPVIDSARAPLPAPASCPRAATPAPEKRKTANTERDEIIDAMERAGWVQARAARLLGMTPRQIAYALKKHDIEVRKF
ncbi:MAG: nif-specific transcriptional activator NifA [Rhodobacteraceae bacterium]|nr:nif-specific transcriptional activator NifA [Paracoccaceae bacterium]